MQLRSFDTAGNPAIFTLNDCPVKVGNDVIATTAITMSPLLSASLIGRGLPVVEGFEGDYVYDADTLLGYVIYVGGFRLLGLDNVLKNLPEPDHIQLKVGDVESMSIVAAFEQRTPLLFSVNNKIVVLDSFVLKWAGRLYTIDGNIVIPPEDVLFNTGVFDKNKKNIFFGTGYQHGEVVLQGYLPYVRFLEGGVPLHELILEE